MFCVLHIQCNLLQFTGLYFSGDGALRDLDGHYRITGRIDDVINVSGHRIGTAEIEDAMVCGLFTCTNTNILYDNMQ